LTSPKSAKAGAEAVCEPEFSLFRSSLPAAHHTSLFLVLYLSPSKYTIMEGLRELTKIMATTNDTVVETQFVRCVVSLTLRLEFTSIPMGCCVNACRDRLVVGG
jgi:hypothetical protein